VYFLYEGIKGADAAIKSIREAFASAGKATTMVDLQRASANIAAATVGQGASLLLSLLSIISSVSSLKGKIAKIKEANPQISDEDALNKALEDSPKEARLKALASRAQIRQKMNLRDAAWWQRGRYTDRPPQGIDRTLLDKACDIRAAEGATLENFTKYNVAVARVRVNGKIEYLDSANTPGALHSEDWILVQIHKLKTGGGPYRSADVVLESLYTERVPCTA